MERRFDYRGFAPEPVQAMQAMEKYIACMACTGSGANAR